MGAAVFNMAMGQGVNAGLNAGNQYVDAAWDVTEKNKGFGGNYQNSFKKVNKDLKKQKLADLAGVNVFSMLETIISAGIRDEMKADDRGFYKELGMSGAEARAQVSLDDSNEALREKKNKEIENVEKRNKNYDKKQAAQREKQRKQEEKEAQLANANQGMTPDDVKGEQGEAKGMFGEAQDGNQDDPFPMFHENSGIPQLLASVDGMMRTNNGSGGTLDASGMTEEEYKQARLVAEMTKGQNNESGTTESGNKASSSHTVQKNETLSDLAKKYNMTVDQIKALNPGAIKKWGNVEGFEAGAKIKVTAEHSKQIEINENKEKNSGGNSKAKNINPKIIEIDKKLEELSKQYKVPLTSLKALIKSESSYRQYSKDGEVLKPYDSQGKELSSAVGLTQILKPTAKLYGFDYDKLQTDWEYNLECGAKIFSDNYNHKWNNKITDVKTRSTRAYSIYHDGFKLNNIYKTTITLRNSTYENWYLKNY